MGNFSGKTAVITGSGRDKGLGQAIAQKLAEEGANIVVSDIGSQRDEATEAKHIGSTDAMDAVAKGWRSMADRSAHLSPMYDSVVTCRR